MASESETVMAVCAEWRDCIESADPSVWNDERIAGLVKTTKAQQIAYLDRIEATWRREKAEIEAEALAVGGIVESARHKPDGNAAAMREALEKLVKHYCTGCQNDTKDGCGLGAENPMCREFRKVRAALSAPARQCDVGTAEEQERRYERFCDTHKWVDDEGVNACLSDCPLYNTSECALHWAQTPYVADEKRRSR